MRNLIEKYPFIAGRTYAGEITYDRTLLDDVPEGWEQLVLDMCEEIKVQLDKEGNPEYEVLQAKEKFGALRWYDNGSEAIQDIIDKYEKISARTCCRCGKPAKWISNGWICPFCDDCKDSMEKKGRTVEFREMRDR